MTDFPFVDNLYWIEMLWSFTFVWISEKLAILLYKWAGKVFVYNYIHQMEVVSLKSLKRSRT